MSTSICFSVHIETSPRGIIVANKIQKPSKGKPGGPMSVERISQRPIHGDIGKEYATHSASKPRHFGFFEAHGLAAS